MRKVLYWRVAGLVAGLLGFMVLGGLAAVQLFNVEVHSPAVGLSAVAACTLIITSVCLFASAAILQENDRTEVRAEHAEIQQQLTEVLKSVNLLRECVERRNGEVTVLARNVRAMGKRMGATERQLHAARSAELVLSRAQRQVDQRSAELGGTAKPLHLLR